MSRYYSNQKIVEARGWHNFFPEDRVSGPKPLPATPYWVGRGDHFMIPASKSYVAAGFNRKQRAGGERFCCLFWQKQEDGKWKLKSTAALRTWRHV
jgi:hypothetical protein